MSLSPHPAPPELLAEVVYELLDAHLDTVELAGAYQDDRWRAHLDYLRALQRKAHELLANAAAADPAPSGEASQ